MDKDKRFNELVDKILTEGVNVNEFIELMHYFDGQNFSKGVKP